MCIYWLSLGVIPPQRTNANYSSADVKLCVVAETS